MVTIRSGGVSTPTRQCNLVQGLRSSLLVKQAMSLAWLNKDWRRLSIRSQ
jgi:hypothetical protein